jgi:hypothetical protein
MHIYFQGAAEKKIEKKIENRGKQLVLSANANARAIPFFF